MQPPEHQFNRAKCRKIRSQAAADVQAAVNSYFADHSTSVEEIVTVLDQISQYAQSPKLTAALQGYFEETLDVEEFICAAQEGGARDLRR